MNVWLQVSSKFYHLDFVQVGFTPTVVHYFYQEAVRHCVRQLGKVDTRRVPGESVTVDETKCECAIQASV